jgi:hypothetical protein
MFKNRVYSTSLPMLERRRRSQLRISSLAPYPRIGVDLL